MDPDLLRAEGVAQHCGRTNRKQDDCGAVQN
jgi:hypothetical protein